MVFGSPIPNSRPKLPPNGQPTLTINLNRTSIFVTNPRIGRQPQPLPQCIRQRTLRPRCCLSARRIQSNGLKQIACRTQLAALGLLDHCRQNIFRSAFQRALHRYTKEAVEAIVD
jgi:hypothetical protein